MNPAQKFIAIIYFIGARMVSVVSRVNMLTFLMMVSFGVGIALGSVGEHVSQIESAFFPVFFFGGSLSIMAGIWLDIHKKALGRSGEATDFVNEQSRYRTDDLPLFTNPARFLYALTFALMVGTFYLLRNHVKLNPDLPGSFCAGIYAEGIVFFLLCRRLLRQWGIALLQAPN